MRKRQPRFFRKAFGNPVVLLQPRRWCVSDPLPPSASLPLVRGRRERSEREGRSRTIFTHLTPHHQTAMPRDATMIAPHNASEAGVPGFVLVSTISRTIFTRKERLFEYCIG